MAGIAAIAGAMLASVAFARVARIPPTRPGLEA